MMRYRAPMEPCFFSTADVGLGSQPSHGVIVFFLQIDTLVQKNSNRDKHLQNRVSETPCAFSAD